MALPPLIQVHNTYRPYPHHHMTSSQRKSQEHPGHCYRNYWELLENSCRSVNLGWHVT
ncbi:Hypothetical predicted protein [Pelobates cultripes]|uniref:Uncharacterized protein n=1 Tax=Pelobates cultripes TaxID=61616 RepID=A0AAD1QYP9_PELCU|nr:Hypothetical predicted protein [Pelobates cultripes]